MALILKKKDERQYKIILIAVQAKHIDQLL